MVEWTIKFDKGMADLRKWSNQTKAWLQIEIPALTVREAEHGKEFAAKIAPEDSGDLINAIAVRKGNKKEVDIVSRTPKGKNKRRIPYQVYLHAGKRGYYTGKTVSGDHNYMDTTYNHMKNRYPDRVERALDKQIRK